MSLSVFGQSGNDAGMPAQANAAAPAANTLWIIPHTHWEGAVFKTREEYLEIGLPYILTALHLLEKYPEYRFVLDQVAYVKPFIERYPEEAPVFRKMVAEGRLQLVGANDVMLDVNIPSGESWVRQALYGKTYYREKLGADVTVGWALDTFGHHAQMPQLLKLAGYKSYWFQRGVHGNNTPSEFLWEGIDGTRIPAFWLPWGYGMFYPAPGAAPDFDRYAREQWRALGEYSRWPERVAVAGADVIEPEETLPAMVRAFNAEGAKPFTLRFGVPTDFESVVARRSNQPVVNGELNPVFQGVYSTRIELKQWMRELESALSTAEKLNALAAWLGFPAENAELARAWEPVLFNQAHDLSSGTMVDKVYEDTIRGYQFSKSLAEETAAANFDSIASQIDTGAQGIPVVVFNPLGWPRSDLAEVEIGYSDRDHPAVELIGPAGDAVPIQFVAIERYGEGGIKHAKLAFIARDVPALGYSLYQVIPRRAGSKGGEGVAAASPGPSSTMHQDTGSIENEYCRATFNLWTGEMTKLLVKAGDWEALGGRSANVVAEEQDGGDFWELYGTLNGGRLTAMTRGQGLPAHERSHSSNEWVGGDGRTEAGPVFSQFHIAHPFGEGSFETSVRLYPGIRRVDIRTNLLNNDKFVRYRVLFPTSISNGRRFEEIPFGAVERPTAQEFPAQNWSDWSDGTRGVALINRGLPGNNVAEGTLMLSLLRSARITAYPFFGGYEPGVSSDLGLELGVRRTFDYALLPHQGDWSAAQVYRAGWEFNNPLLVRKASLHPGRLPKRWGLLEVSASDVVVSALKPGRDGELVLRVYEAAGRPSPGIKIKLNAAISSAREVNLIEDPAAELHPVDDTLQFDLGAYQIKTFSLKLGPLERSR
jgi:alpha-mannosidase